MLSPIVLFVYNRPWHTQKTIEALSKNLLAADSALYIFSDAPKNIHAEKGVEEVRKHIKQLNGFNKVEIIEQTENKGLASSVISGVSAVLENYERVIVLEDDLVTSPYFLRYMNRALDFYADNGDIYSVTGFNFSQNFMQYPDEFNDDVYAHIRPMSWSWGTWKRNWVGIDWSVSGYDEFITSKEKIRAFNLGGTDLTNMLKLQMQGELDSWYIRWTYNAFLKQKLTVYPRVSFINNIGHDSTGVHCQLDKKGIFSHQELSDNDDVTFIPDLSLIPSITSRYNRAFNLPMRSRFKQGLKSLLR